MPQFKTYETNEDRRDPQFINAAALEAEHNTISKLLKRDKWRGRREFATLILMVLLTITVWDEVSNEQVYAWRITEGLDGVERTDFVEPFSVNASIIAAELRDWLQHVRMVSPDVVAHDKLKNAARARMDTKIQLTKLNLYIQDQVNMPGNRSRDVLENTFGFTQLSNGGSDNQGQYTFVFNWYEREFLDYIPQNGMEMQASVTMKVRPPTSKEQRQGKLEPLFVSDFDFRPRRSLTLEELDTILAEREKKSFGS